MALISFTSPQPANGQVTSGPITISRAVSITGTVYSDVDGTIFIDQGGDGRNWDTTVTSVVKGGIGAAIDVPVISEYFQIRYINGGTPQTQFRLFVDPRDPYGAFLAKALPASAGGQFAILFWSPNANTYQYLGRYDGSDAWGAITAAAITTNAGGKYAAFDVGLATVSNEVIMRSTDHSPDAF